MLYSVVPLYWWAIGRWAILSENKTTIMSPRLQIPGLRVFNTGITACYPFKCSIYRTRGCAEALKQLLISTSFDYRELSANYPVVACAFQLRSNYELSRPSRRASIHGPQSAY